MTHRRGAPGSSFAPVVLPMERRTVARMVLSAMRERILRGVYREGEPLRQDALADDLGVSRLPIREALRQLEAEGLVTFNPHRGAIVSALSLPEIEEVFALRAHMETELLRRSVPVLTREQLQRASDVLEAWDRALDDGDLAAYGELNWQFHSTLYAPAERPITMLFVQRLHQHSDRYLRMQLALTHDESRASEEHRSIVEAARRRETRRACALLRLHIEGTGASLLAFLTERRASERGFRRRPVRS